MRKRPGMYIGDTSDGTGLHHMVFEVLDNAIDEALAGYCDDIKVVIHADNSVSVVDNGRGIPTDIKDDDDAEALRGRDRDDRIARRRQVRPEQLQGVRRPPRRRRVGGQRALRLARSSGSGATARRTRWSSAAACAVAPLAMTGSTDRRGTEVHFMASPETFGRVEYHYEILAKRIRELSFLNNGTKIELIDQRDGKSENFAYSGGIRGFVEYMNRSKAVLHPKIFHAHRRKGRHDRRGRDAMERLVRRERPMLHQQHSAARRRHAPDRPAAGDDADARTTTSRRKRSRRRRRSRRPATTCARACCCVLSVKVPEPKFSSQTKDKLVSSEVHAGRPGDRRREARRLPARESGRREDHLHARSSTPRGRAKPRARRASSRAERACSTRWDCPASSPIARSAIRALCELYLVEGDSAGGSAKQGRDRKFQAILPLRGKILNVERARFDKLVSSQEIVTLITALGTGFGDRSDKEERTSTTPTSCAITASSS